MGVPLESAVRAASENPARSIGIDNDYGSLSAGRYGNVILADEALNIQAVRTMAGWMWTLSVISSTSAPRSSAAMMGPGSRWVMPGMAL